MDDRPIRPDADHLRGLPTLDVITPAAGVSEATRKLASSFGVDFRLELKLKTTSHAYWLCTQGADAPRQGMPNFWVEGYVSREPLDPDGNGEKWFISYGPEETATWQKIDYISVLTASLNEAMAAAEADPTPENRRRVSDVKAELEAFGLLKTPDARPR